MRYYTLLHLFGALFYCCNHDSEIQSDRYNRCTYSVHSSAVATPSLYPSIIQEPASHFSRTWL